MLAPALIIGGVSAVAVATPASASTPAAASASPTEPAVVRILADTNAVRAAAGKPALKRNTALDAVAQKWAAQQYLNGAMSHNPNYSTQIPAGWSAAGENVANGYAYTEVVGAWRNSKPHYANLIGNYTDMGTGFYEANGQRYYSQVFAAYPASAPPVVSPPSSTVAAPAVTLSATSLAAGKKFTVTVSRVNAGATAIATFGGKSYRFTGSKRFVLTAPSRAGMYGLRVTVTSGVNAGKSVLPVVRVGIVLSSVSVTAPAAVHVNARFVVKGSIGVARAGAKVSVYYSKSKTRGFVKLTSTTTAKNGVYVAKPQIRATGSYYIQVIVSGDARFSSVAQITRGPVRVVR